MPTQETEILMVSTRKNEGQTIKRLRNTKFEKPNSVFPIHRSAA
uniref:Uncharacterized protein n=1 Tax=Arundo donax TaxID=35708 RepID=A0A0A9E0J1_ARUDO